MREFRKKQKKLKKIMTSLIVFTAVFLFIYIGIEPYIKDVIGTTGAIIINYTSNILVILCMVILFVYFSKYGKSDKFLKSIENELSDTGYYFYSREQTDIDSYIKAIKEDMINSGFSVNDNVDADEFTFTTRGLKKKEFIYIVGEETIDKNDIIAYQSSAIYDILSVNLKRKGDGIVVFVCDKADNSAIELSKAITPLGNKNQIIIANAIIELSTKRCYFLGNDPTKCQQMIANYIMGCSLPIESKYIGDERLPFQDDLEERMKDFNIKDFKNGKFYAH